MGLKRINIKMVCIGGSKLELLPRATFPTSPIHWISLMGQTSSNESVASIHSYPGVEKVHSHPFTSVQRHVTFTRPFPSPVS